MVVIHGLAACVTLLAPSEIIIRIDLALNLFELVE